MVRSASCEGQQGWCGATIHCVPPTVNQSLSSSGSVLGSVVTMFYLVFAVVMLVLARQERWLVPLVLVGACVDILIASLATHCLPDATAGIAMLLICERRLRYLTNHRRNRHAQG